MRKNECIEAKSQMRFVREPSTNAERVAHFAVMFRRGKCNVVDLRVAAPRGAARGANLELAREVIERWIRRQQMSDLDSDGRGVNQFIGGNPGQRASGHIADHI